MRRRLIFLCLVLPLGTSLGLAAIDSMSGPTYLGGSAADLDAWQRIDFQPSRVSLRRALEIKIAIQTKGPSMQGLVRIPGGLASNFDTGQGQTAVDLINPGDESRGYADGALRLG